MSEPPFEPEVPVSEYGAQRRAAWLAGLQANADMAKTASMQAHGQSEDRRVTQAGQAGIFRHMSPTDKGQAVAERQAVVGSDYDSRPLQRLGGTFDHAATGPAPARVDLRFVDQQQLPGESPTMRWARERNQ
jgi:hypothetical protein